MARGNPAQVALGPGYIFIAELGATEPTDLTGTFASASAAWKGPWYTKEGSEFKYSLKTDTVEVAEELDPLSTPVTGRTGTVTFALAEMTGSNLARAFNAPMSTIAAAGGVITMEPPDLGTELRRMMGWESEDHTERWIFRQCFQTGDTTITRAKGAANATISIEYTLEKPASGSRLFKVIMSAARLGV